jgi:signal transduction histidine kinase
MSLARTTHAPSADAAESPDAVEADVRQLITDLRDAAQDGQLLAERFAETLKRTVEAYCVEFEQRADDLLVRLERSR